MSQPENEPSNEPKEAASEEPESGISPGAGETVPLAKPVDQSRPSHVQELQGHQSVFDEPDIFPGWRAEVIDQDWSCSECGYNLRGLPTGRRCPECGHVELYRPPPPGAVSYASWYQEKKAGISEAWSWWIVAGITGLVGVLAFVSSAMLIVPSVVMGGIMAPVVAESIKIGTLVWAVDARPYWFRSSRQLQLCAVLCALVFAAIQNVVVFQMQGVAMAGSLPVIFWRWLGCPLLHSVFSLYAVSAVTRGWEKADREYRRAAGREMLKPLLIAIVLHAIINLMLHGWGLSWAAF